MRDKIITENDIIKSFLYKESKQDSLLITSGFTLIAGFIGLLALSTSLTTIVASLFILSIVSLVISCLLLIWYNPRLILRNERWKRILEEIIDKTKEDVREYVQKYEKASMLSSFLKTVEEVAKKNKVRSADDLRKAVSIAAEIEKARRVTYEKGDVLVKLFMKSLLLDIDLFHEKIFNEPLKGEDNAQLKHYLDIISAKARYHFYVIGVSTLMLGVVAFLLRI